MKNHQSPVISTFSLHVNSFTTTPVSYTHLYVYKRQKTSLKAVLLNNGNTYASLPVAHSVHMKESYENLYVVLNKIKCVSKISKINNV